MRRHRDMRRHRAILSAVLIGSVCAPILAGELAPPAADAAGFEGVPDPAAELFELPEPWSVLKSRGLPPEELLDEVVTLDHDVPISEGRTLRLRETFTPRSWLRWPRRAVLFLGSAFSRGDLWSVPVPGYDGTALMARRGFFAYTVDYLGVGDSYRPRDGLESTFEANQEALKTVLRYVRARRAVPLVDLVAESWGGVHAIYLGADAGRVRAAVLSTMTYEVAARPEFLTQEFLGFLDSLEHHYFPMGPEFFQELTTGAPPEVTAWATRTQPGLYLITHFRDSILQGLPHFDPGVARAPAMIVSGSLDRPEDGRRLAQAYGTRGAEFSLIEGAGHGPRLETPESARRYWEIVVDFLDPNPTESHP